MIEAKDPAAMPVHASCIHQFWSQGDPLDPFQDCLNLASRKNGKHGSLRCCAVGIKHRFLRFPFADRGLTSSGQSKCPKPFRRRWKCRILVRRIGVAPPQKRRGLGDFPGEPQLGIDDGQERLHGNGGLTGTVELLHDVFARAGARRAAVPHSSPPGRHPAGGREAPRLTASKPGTAGASRSSGLPGSPGEAPSPGMVESRKKSAG